MFTLNRIGNKLGIAGALGIVLAITMVANQQITSSSVMSTNADTTNQQQITQNAIATEVSMRRMQLAVRDMRIARLQSEVDKAVDQLNSAKKTVDTKMDSVIGRAVHPESKERFRKVKSLLDNYAVAANEFAKAQTDYFLLLNRRLQATTNWMKAVQEVRAVPALPGSDSRDLALKLAGIENLFQDVCAAMWRFSATGETAQKEQMVAKSAALLDAISDARNFAGGKGWADAIAGLNVQSKDFIGIINETLKMEDAKAVFIQQRTLPLANQSAELLGTAVSAAQQAAEDAAARASGEIASAGYVGLTIGVVAALVLLGSMVFSFLGVSRPLTRLNGAMEKMAAGQTDIDIPGTKRGDEIGDMAKTITVIRQNAERQAIEKQAEVQHEETQRAAQRKADMTKLANDFEGAVGEIIQTVSSAATELEASAKSLTSTAVRTEELSTVVASAAEEASTNVQSVASASEEMSSSVNEISRQVQESARIAGDAVSQAEKTNARVNELSESAKKIGDVVKLISTIAEQTNLLALNATIEAARAGDAGRGFAVVASEVKALAEQTSKATGEIGQQIMAIQTATEGSVMAIREIGQTIGRISEISSTIAAAVEEQGAATQEISRNVQQAAQGTSDVASNISDVQRGSSETGSASSQVLSSAQSLSVESNRLKSEVQNFLSTVRAA